MKQHLSQALTVLASWKLDPYPQLILGSVRSWSDILTSATVFSSWTYTFSQNPNIRRGYSQAMMNQNSNKSIL